MHINGLLSSIYFLSWSEGKLVFLDLNMPGKNDVQVLAEISKIRPECRVCIISAYFEAFAKDLDKLKTQGIAFEVKEKPLGIEQIKEIVGL